MGKSRLSFSRHNHHQHKRQQVVLNSIIGLSIFLLLVGAVVVTKPGGRLISSWVWSWPFQNEEISPIEPELEQLLTKSPSQRQSALEVMAQEKQSLQRARARYLLASDLVAQGQGEEALEWLEGLENRYSVLGGYVVLLRAQAYELIEDREKASQTWQHLLEVYTNEPVAANALFAFLREDSPYRQSVIEQVPDQTNFLDRVQNIYTFSADNPLYFHTALENYPSHPLLIELIRQQLVENPNDSALMLHLARHAYDQPETIPVLDRLVSFYRPAIGQEEYATIQSEDWEFIARGYWNDLKYGQASAAYQNAERTPRHIYLAALGLQYSRQQNQAERAYKDLIEEFPEAEESANALFNLASLQPDLESVPYLDRIVKDFPQRAGEALLIKANTLKRLGSQAGADQTSQKLLTDYNDSDAAAEYRWQSAQEKAEAGDKQSALSWVEPIRQNNLESETAREAVFWEGKWAKDLGKQQQAEEAFQAVLANYPWSYYAWRSAVHLGLDVGDFDQIRSLSPEIQLPSRPTLPTGSTALKELYQLGQNEEAWRLWQVEFQDSQDPTIAEQFTDGLLHQANGDYLNGIALIWGLEQKDSKEDKAQYKQLKQQHDYWQGIYPFPYGEMVIDYGKEQKLNPLLSISIMRQESRFDPDVVSSADALGLMQIIPSTAEWAAENIGREDYDLRDPDDNIALGTWFLAQLHQSYQDDSLPAVASYNAGQGNVGSWLSRRGSLDDDEFVESIPFDETRDYVKQVFGNYWNYIQLYDPEVGNYLGINETNPEN